MPAPKNFVTGFNHNIKHKGKIYHIQTEDSGADAAHIITHLFVGGNILASKKSSYAELRGQENLKEVVRERMEEQHKDMLRNLIAGAYDELEAAHSAGVKAFKPGQIAVGDREVQLNAGTPGGSPVADMHDPAAAPPKPVSSPVPSRSMTPAPAATSAAAAKPAPAAPAAPAAAKPAPAAPKPAPVPAATKPAGLLDGGDSLFGGDLISEKSLDEVILSYLAGEGEGERK